MGLLNLTARRAWVIFGPGFSRAGPRLLPAARRVGARQQMIFFSVGVPSRFAEWCDALIAALVAKAHGPADLAGGNTLEEIGRALLQSKEEHLIVSTRQLAEDLRAALANAGAPFVLSFDDPRIAVKNLIDVHGLDPIAAIRATATSCAAVLNTSMMDGALVLRADHDSADPIAAASRIAEHFHLPLGASDIAERVAAMPALPSNAEEREPAAEAAWEPVATGALDAYREYFSNHALGDIVWARDLFFWGDKPQQAATGVIDLAGEIRALLFGPYIVLPPGYWHGTMTLAVSPEANGMSFSVEVLAGARCALLAQTSFVPDGRGVCRAAFSFSIDESTDQPIALRLTNTRHVAAGRLAFGQVALQMQTETNAEIPVELATALAP
jgi:hypothetical protein